MVVTAMPTIRAVTTGTIAIIMMVLKDGDDGNSADDGSDDCN